MKQLFFTNWTLMRFVRLILGVIIIVQGFVAKDALFAIAGFLFTTMALLNAGCCATGNCYINNKPLNNSKQHTPVEYEEVV
jgi:hypothetical protein